MADDAIIEVFELPMSGKNERRQTRRPATKFAHLQKKMGKQKSQTERRNERKK